MLSDLVGCQLHVQSFTLKKNDCAVYCAVEVRFIHQNVSNNIFLELLIFCGFNGFEPFWAQKLCFLRGLIQFSLFKCNETVLSTIYPLILSNFRRSKYSNFSWAEHQNNDTLQSSWGKNDHPFFWISLACLSSEIWSYSLSSERILSTFKKSGFIFYPDGV